MIILFKMFLGDNDFKNAIVALIIGLFLWFFTGSDKIKLLIKKIYRYSLRKNRY